jgi:hypothetical protein
MRDGEPCSHRGCLNHISHPCEGCGRIAGKTSTYTLVDGDANAWECSECKEWWVLTDGIPKDNYMNYCPKCGSKIEEIKIKN